VCAKTPSKSVPLTLFISLKLAVATAEGVIYLFNDQGTKLSTFLTGTGRSGEKKDKFKTKALDPNSIASYIVKALAFSPDSTKLAVAQSDQCVFVYRSVLNKTQLLM